VACADTHTWDCGAAFGAFEEFGSPDEVFRAPLRRLEACNLPASSAQAIVKNNPSSAREGPWRIYGRLPPQAIGAVGTGIDVCYPKENKKLYEKVLENGAILSEFPLGTHPAPENFPIRNRIVAGMPLGAIIAEGAQYSGSLITARLAMEFGREVFGVPGNVTQPMSFQPNQWIKQGAKLVTRAEDMIEELPTPVRAACYKSCNRRPARRIYWLRPR
jgi:DNA recombination-mediator protein A